MSRRRRRIRAVDIAVICVAVALLVWAFVPGIGPDIFRLGGSGTLWGSARSDRILRQAPSTPLIEAIRQLKVHNGRAGGHYERSAFGPAWADVDHNGCDTRNDILKRDLSHIAFRARTHRCVVSSGEMLDPYTGRQIHFVKGPNSAKVQIDHVVALADAWRSGAYQWSAATREKFANDPLNLLAVDGPANQDKKADAADKWLPPNKGYRCAYVARQVAVKKKWDLWVTQEEKNAIVQVAATCPDEPLPR